jgi:catechol-2,3-dioxygenase
MSILFLSFWTLNVSVNPLYQKVTCLKTQTHKQVGNVYISEIHLQAKSMPMANIFYFKLGEKQSLINKKKSLYFYKTWISLVPHC